MVNLVSFFCETQKENCEMKRPSCKKHLTFYFNLKQFKTVLVNHNTTYDYTQYYT